MQNQSGVADSDSVNLGSNPSPPAKAHRAHPATRHAPRQVAGRQSRSDRLDRNGSVERHFSEVRESKAYAEQPSASTQRRPGGAGFERSAGECWKLARLPYDRAEYGEHIRRAVVAQTGDRGRRKHAVRRIDDRATRGKWNPVRGGNARGNM